MIHVTRAVVVCIIGPLRPLASLTRSCGMIHVSTSCGCLYYRSSASTGVSDQELRYDPRHTSCGCL